MSVKKPTEAPAVPSPPATDTSPSCPSPASPPADPRGPAAWVAPPGKIDKNTVYQDGFVRIISKKPLSPERAHEIAERVERAYAFDQETQGWADAAPLRTQINVKVMPSKDILRKYGPETGAIATDANTIVIPGDQDVARGSDDDIVAHELSHIQDDRESLDSKGRKQVWRVPAFIAEGKAWALGNRFDRIEEGHALEAVKFVRESTAKLSANEVREVLQRYQFETLEGAPLGEPTGALYVEFLRTRLNGPGLPDVIPRLARMIHDVGQGVRYEVAFQKELGLPPQQAEAAFLEFIRATEKNATERFRGTIYALPAE